MRLLQRSDWVGAVAPARAIAIGALDPHLTHSRVQNHSYLKLTAYTVALSRWSRSM
jgi:hypothetical protein